MVLHFGVQVLSVVLNRIAAVCGVKGFSCLVIEKMKVDALQNSRERLVVAIVDMLFVTCCGLLRIHFGVRSERSMALRYASS